MKARKQIRAVRRLKGFGLGNATKFAASSGKGMRREAIRLCREAEAFRK